MEKKAYPIDPMGLILLSARQALKRIQFWARLAIWRIFFSIPIVTMPAAKAAFYQGIAEGLKDPFDQHVQVRAVFVRGFFDHLVRSTLASVVNLLSLGAIVFGILFWSYQEQFWLNLLAGLALPFLLFWWFCQPYLYPVLVAHPKASLREVFLILFRLVAGNLLYSFVMAFSLTLLFLTAIPLVGPLSLFTVPFLALFAQQAFWAMSGETIPDLLNPVRYADLMESSRKADRTEEE